MRKMQRDYLIQQLQSMRVVNGRNGELLSNMDYRSLISLLAVQRVVAE
ncbi:Fur-regulated basic protein FbpA [Sporosarcina sp. ANT_H38]